MKQLAVIGPGKVGRTLARLFHEQGVFEIGALVATRPETAQSAAKFIGAGRADGALDDADIILVAVPDPALEGVLLALAAHKLKAGTIIAHTSGALGFDLFEPLSSKDVRVCCAHPVKAFSDAEAAVQSFAGTMTTLQGEVTAWAELAEAFKAIGGQTMVLDDQVDRALYHAAIVSVCNHLPALVESGLKTFEANHIPRAEGLNILAPILRDLLDAILRVGPAAALTGPVSRGDANTVAHHLEKLGAVDADTARLYAALANATADLAAEKGEAPVEGLLAIRALTKLP